MIEVEFVEIEVMDKQLCEIKEYLKYSYSGAKMMGDVEGMVRISRALAALQADVETDIFTEEFLEGQVEIEI